jgi:putative DNA primase/helicase
MRTVSGYFDDWEKLAQAVATLEAAGYPGIYWTINPTDSALLARAANKVKGYVNSGDCSSDENTVRRWWLPLDLDVKRPAGISSTDAEHEAALALALHVQAKLIVDGWGPAIYADSGNGAHLLYAIDLPNDQESKDLLSRVLTGLAARFNTRAPDVPVEVDRTMFNASRILKIYGTTARKGDATADRPHRLSRILQAPAELTAVSRELLAAQAAEVPAKARYPALQASAKDRGPRGGPEFDIEDFLGRHGIRYRTKLAYEGGWKYQLEECPWDAAHKYPDACVFDYPDGFGFRCLHNSCQGHDWRAFRELFEGPRPVRYRNTPAPRDEDVPPPAPGDMTGQNPPPLPPAKGDGEGAEEPPDLIGYPLTDSGNGERIVALFGRDIRYCTEMQSWFVWDTRRWAVDHANLMRQKAMEMARLLYYQASKLPEGQLRTVMDKHARASESSSGITNALREAERICGIPVSAQALDQYPDHFNFLNGTLYLRDGSIRPHERFMLLTKLCEYDYRPEARCPLFQVFIEWAMGGPLGGNPDAELPEMTVRLVSFIQRVIGYSITGSVSEKAVFVFYGADGDNGKTTLLTVFRELLGRDYASLLLIDTIMHARNTDNTAREDMADLRGARFVQTSEICKEDRLNEQRIKFLTQGMGTIKSRRLHEHLVEFTATHKLLMDCNYRPKVTGQDNAIWRRLVQIPFLVTISEDKKDSGLLGKLKAEVEGILAWAVRGAVEWYKHGLGKPPEVVEAQQDWREHDDPVREFLADWCDLGEGLYCPVADLMSAYLLWAKEYGEKFPLARRAFNESLVGKGIKQDRKCVEKVTTRIWTGIELKSSTLQRLHPGEQGRFY